MMNIGDKISNPCNLCSQEKDQTEGVDEYLEFSLSGNNTALYVREVSVEDITKEKDEEAAIEDEPDSQVSQGRFSDPQKTGVTPTKTIIRNTGIVDDGEFNNKQLTALYTKKWSGNTYFEEEIRRLREEQYKKDVSHALKMRKLYKQLQKEVQRDVRLSVIKSSGPEWWQEPSKKQIMLATTLGDVIKADYEEEVTGRTRQWLLDLGVTARFTAGQVRKCMKSSLLEPVDFLLETHAVLVKLQKNIKKKRGDLERPFSINERLLLSAVCVLQLPTLLTMLHFILPPPEPYPTDKFTLEILFGDLEDQSIRYSTPYMEPLPFRNQKDFEEWAFDKIIRALLPTVLQDAINFDELNKKSSMTSVITTNTLRDSIKSFQKASQTPRLSAYSVAPSIAILLSYCLSKRHESASLRVLEDQESVNRRTYDGRLTHVGSYKKPKFVALTKPDENENNPQIENALSVVSPHEEADSRLRESARITSLVETPEQTRFLNAMAPEYYYAGYGQQAGYGYGQQANYDWAQESYYPASDYYQQHYQQFENILQEPFEDGSPEPKLESRSKTKLAALRRSTVEAPSVGYESEHPDFPPQAQPEFDHSELERIWDEIGSYPEKEQLRIALKILSDMGDPLAQLPKINELPTIQRWLEFRRGKNRILSKKTKADLLNRSRQMWKSAHTNCSTQGPKIDITKREERKLTWAKKKWLDVELKKEMGNYFSRIRQEKIDNTRIFFPTMLNPYDYGSKLNRHFRDVFYTYLPSREADTFVYRPWRPGI